MDLTQVGLGLALLGLGGLTFAGSTLFDSTVVGAAVAAVGAIVATGALLIGLARTDRSDRVRFRP